MADDEVTDPASPLDREGRVSLDAIPLHSTNLLTVLDESGVVQYESPAIERIYGYDQDELVGEQVAEYFHPDDRAAVVEAFATVVTSEEHTVEAVEYRHERADGTYCWVESVASSDPTPEGHYVVNTRETAERKAREQELERKNEQLEAFASIVGHDLRNPLNVATLRLDQATRKCDSEHLPEVARNLERMERLLNDLLTLARQGEQIGDVEPVQLHDVVTRSWGSVETADATIDCRTSATVHADASRLASVFENMFRNAVEHSSTNSRFSDGTEDGGRAVTVTVGDLLDGDGFYVADDGDGIPAADRERVFESGYSSNAGGTGLGLTIVRSIVEAHGWDVHVTESDDGGARFEVTGVEYSE